MNKLEILSPCGGPESVAAALYTGADAVYLGAKNFSARHNAVNFSEEELEKAVRECHRHGVLVYLAMNTVIRDDELKSAAKTLAAICRMGIDGIIVQDMAIIEMAKAACPEMPLHASTQMTIHTVSGVAAAKKLGLSRVVTARELSLESIRSICHEAEKIGVEIEVFAHGALCMCVSGQCYLSAMIGGRSANRGLCAGACRLPFSAKGAPDRYDFALSLKDMSYCEKVNDLAAAGVKSLKIEGRMKRPEYVAAATDAMKKASLDEKFDSERLKAVFSRSGFTTGYLDNDINSDMFGVRVKDDVTAAESALPELRRLYDKCEKRFGLSLRFTAMAQESMSLYAFDGTRGITVFGDVPEPAKSRSTTEEAVKEQLSKLGGTLYELKNLEIIMEDGLYLPVSKINDLRRQVITELDNARIEELSKPKAFNAWVLKINFSMMKSLKFPNMKIRVEQISQLEKMDLHDEQIIIPLNAMQDYLEAGYDPGRAVLSLPRFDTTEEKTAKTLKNAKNCGFKMVECENIGHVELVEAAGLTPMYGFSFGVTNSVSDRYYARDGLYLPVSKINDLRRQHVITQLGYARFPMVKSHKFPKMRIRVERISQLGKIDLHDEQFVIPLGAMQAYLEAGYDTGRAVLSLPRFDIMEEKTEETLKIAKNFGFNMVECGNIGQIELVKAAGMTPMGGFGLNIANSIAARYYAREGVHALTLSAELRASQLSSISCPGELGFIAYGRLPLMVSRNCPIAAQVGRCSRCTHELTDRTGAKFPVLCHRESGIFELLNSRPMWLADKLNDFNLDFCDLWFTVEPPEECRRIVEEFRTQAKPRGEFTRGLYYRGVE